MTERLLSAVGLVVFMGLAWALSEDRRRVHWRIVFFSLALQFGASIASLARSLGRDGSFSVAHMRTGEAIETPAASILGQICQIAAHLEAADGAEIRRVYADGSG